MGAPRGTVPIPSRCDWSAPLALRHNAKAKDGETKERAMALEALKCKECGEQYALEARYVCDVCFGPLEVEYDFSGLKADEVRRKIQAGPPSIWRYADFLPFEQRPQTALEPGFTPLVRADRLAERLGIRGGWGKNRAAHPTPPFKGRGVTGALARGRRRGHPVIPPAA